MLCVVVIGGYGYYTGWFGVSKSYTIPNVPYFGQFDGGVILSDIQSVVASTLGYWGDEGLGLEAIANKFAIGKSVSLPELAAFFELNGYDTSIEQYRSPDDFTKYVNKNSKTPLILALQLETPEDLPPTKIFHYALLIGVSSKKKLIFHDSLFGNNYEVPLTDFERVTAKTAHNFLVVTPGTELLSQLHPKTDVKPYPARLGIMDSKDITDLSIRWRAVSYLESLENKDLATIENYWKQITTHPAFEQLHPASRITAYVQLARLQRANHKYTEAINTIENFVLPMNHDLNKSFGEWVRDPNAQPIFAIPWLSIERSWFGLGNVAKAKEAFDQALAINPNDPFVKQEIERIRKYKNWPLPSDL